MMGSDPFPHLGVIGWRNWGDGRNGRDETSASLRVMGAMCVPGVMGAKLYDPFPYLGVICNPVEVKGDVLATRDEPYGCVQECHLILHYPCLPQMKGAASKRSPADLGNPLLPSYSNQGPHFCLDPKP